MVLADAWYVSPTFWAAAGALAVVVMGAIAIILTYFMWAKGSPTRRLGYTASSMSLSQDAIHQDPTDLKTIYDDAPVENPHILQINLVSRNRQCLGTENGKPIEFKVRAKIIRVLQIDSSSSFDAVAYHDDVIEVGPATVGRRQSIKLTLLVDGPNPTLTPPSTQHLNIVPEAIQHGFAVRTRWIIGTVATVSVAILVLVGFINNKPSPVLFPPSPTPSAKVSGNLQKVVQPRIIGLLEDATKDLQSSISSRQSDGIEMLQSIIKTTPSEQVNVVQILTKYIRTNSAAGNNDQNVTPNIQSALNVLRTRNPSNDGTAVMDLNNTNFMGAILPGINFEKADLINADFDSAQLSGGNFQDANLSDAFMGESIISNTNFNGANLGKSSFYDTTMCSGSRPTHAGKGYECNPNG